MEVVYIAGDGRNKRTFDVIKEFLFFYFGSSLKSIWLFERAEEVRLEGKIRLVKRGQRGLAALCSLAPRPKGSKPI